jgi:beta-galactosidase
MNLMNLIRTLVALAFAVAGEAQALAADEDAGKRPSLDLSGEWEFRLDPDDAGKAAKWFEGNVPFDLKIVVPGAWNAQGVEYASQTQRREYERKHLNGTNLLGPDSEADKLYHVYPGPAWYRRSVTVPKDWRLPVIWLTFGGVHRSAEVWVNGHALGSHVGYVTPFRFDISPWAKPGEKFVVTVRVDARRNKAVDPLMGCMDTLDFLYVSWGGIHRKVALEATPASWIDNVFAIPHVAEAAVDIRVRRGGNLHNGSPVSVEIRDAGGSAVARGAGAFTAGAAEATLSLKLAEPKLWSPSSPHLYTARVSLADLDSASTRFGLRELKVERGRFLLNGQPIFLRGYGDDCIFPNTIAPPADREEYRRRLQIVKDYGFNYARHHSWIPLEEYLDVADELGVMVQPEFPIAYRWDLATTPEGKRLYLEQWEHVIQLHRNHPSIVTWCMGNELYDSFDLAPEMYRLAKKTDPTRLVIDSDGCRFRNQDRATLDFLVVQFSESASCGFQDRKYDGIPANLSKPVLAHEMGYFITLPDLAQLPLFRSGLRPYWLLEAQALAAKKGIDDQYPQWVDASQRLQAICLKTNLEAARRSRLNGYSQWLFQDYPNCAEGIVDMFFRPKALGTADFRKFNAPTVLLLDAPRRTFHSGETAPVTLLVSRFEDKPTAKAALRWELRAAKEVIAAGSREDVRVTAEGVQELVQLTLAMPRRPAAEKLTLAVDLLDENGKTSNEWNFWVFPDEPLKDRTRKLGVSATAGLLELYPWARQQDSPPRVGECDLLVTSRFDAGTVAYLQEGGRVLLLAPDQAFPTVPSRFRPAGWDPGQKDGHSGILLQKDHPALRALAAESWCDLQFFTLLEGSKIVLLDEVPAKVRPIVRCIDMPQRFLEKAYLFEVSVGKGRLFTSGFNFKRSLEVKDPAGLFLLDQLIRYGLGSDVAPQAALAPDYWKGRVR